jgi:glucose-6-phosphate dehydrogenase assembly protein OpcA
VIYDLPDTTTGAINKKMIELRESGGAVALGRVMTLVIVTDDGPAEQAIRAANDASREHPCRVIAVVRGNRRGTNRLDAQIRVGGDAGASEVIVLRLYGQLADHGNSVVVPFLLPDAPIVSWWPGDGPEVPAEDPIGRMAQRRITDSAASKNPIKALYARVTAGHAPGDTDLAWSRITLWRGLLAAALDEPPYEPVTAATVTGGSDSPSTDLMAGWLRLTLGCPVNRLRTAPGTGMIAVTLDRPSGAVDLSRPSGSVATLTQPGQPDRRIALAPRADRDCLAEEMRRLDPDDVFTEVVTTGLELLAAQGSGVAGKRAAATKPAATKPAARRRTAT